MRVSPSRWRQVKLALSFQNPYTDRMKNKNIATVEIPTQFKIKAADYHYFDDYVNAFKKLGLKFKYEELDTNGGGYLAEFTLIEKKS
jgi:hypothetical protein